MVRSGPRSVDIAGDATGAIIVTGDGNAVAVHRGGAPIFALSPLAARIPVPPDAGPAALLMARYELAEFVGREEFRGEAPQWLASDPRRAVRLVTGRGGQGKTRFGLQVARDATDDRWQVLLARHALDGGLIDVEDAPEPVPIPDNPVGVLVLVDYADRWPPQDLLELLTRPEASRGRVRMLLLGRSAAFWSPLGQMLTRAGIGVSQRHLQPLADHGPTRQRMFDTATTAFARQLAIPIEPLVEGPNLQSPGFDLTLAIHIAALVTVLRRRDGQAAAHLPDQPALDDPAALSRELLIREVHHWQTMTQRRVNPVRLSRETMARAVLIATLTRTTLPAPSALTLLQALQIGADPHTVLDDHALCYPPSRSDIVLEPLYPDRLGEDFIAAVLPGGPVDDHDSASLAFLADPTSPDILAKLLQPTHAPATSYPDHAGRGGSAVGSRRRAPPAPGAGRVSCPTFQLWRSRHRAGRHHPSPRTNTAAPRTNDGSDYRRWNTSEPGRRRDRRTRTTRATRPQGWRSRRPRLHPEHARDTPRSRRPPRRGPYSRPGSHQPV
jgi:hypothetical protein